MMHHPYMMMSARIHFIIIIIYNFFFFAPLYSGKEFNIYPIHLGWFFFFGWLTQWSETHFNNEKKCVCVWKSARMMKFFLISYSKSFFSWSAEFFSSLFILFQFWMNMIQRERENVRVAERVQKNSDKSNTK